MSNGGRSDDSNADLERKAKALFDGGVEQLDARTRSRLTQARNRALDELRRGSAQRRWLTAPIGALAAAVIVAVTLALWPGLQRAPADASDSLEDVDIVADAENLDMLEDVDFYLWLDDSKPDQSG